MISQMSKVRTDEKVISDTFRKSANVMIIGCVTTFIGTTIDSIITSRMLGVTYVSSFQIVQPLILIVTVLVGLIANGLQNVYAKLIGGGKLHEAHTVMSMSMVILGVTSAVCAVIYCLLAHPIVSGLGAADMSSLLHTEAVGYLYGIAPGLIGICLQQMLSYVAIMEGRQNVVLLAVVAQTAENVAGDIMAAKVFHNGLFGMGIASSICYYVAIAVLLISMIKKPVTYRFTLKGASPAALLDVFKMGLPVAAERLYLVLQTLFLNTILLSRVGADAVAAYAILSTLNNLLQSVATGTAGTTFAMASVYVGDKDAKSLRGTLSAAMRFTIIMECVVLVLVLVCADLIIIPFIGTDGAAVQKMATFGLRAIALSVPLYGINHTFQRYIQAVGEMKKAYLIPALGGIIFFVPTASILLLVAGENGIWFAFFAGEGLAMITIMVMTAVHVHHAAIHLEDYLYLPDDMRRDVKTLEGSVDSMIALEELSERSQMYCEKEGGDKTRAMLIALAIEEMGGNIFRYNKKKVTVDFRLLIKEDIWVLGIRDNGRPFDPVQWMEIHHADEKEKNIGIRTIYGLSSSFEYVSIMSMNNLIIGV